MNPDLTRRAVTAALAASLAPLPLRAAANALCPNDPAISNAAAPLTIDTHAHFFNGSDLQVKEFLSKTVVGEDSELYPLVSRLGALLQSLAWHQAPDAGAETAAIARYAAALESCRGADQLRRSTAASFQEGYAIGRQQLVATAGDLYQSPAGAAVLGPKGEMTGLGAAIADLPPTFAEFEERRADATGVLASQPTLLGYLQFVLHNFNYRHVNAIDYLTTYSRNSPRKVDLVVASMVDYDWWLAQGKPTRTSLADQIDLMGQISVLLAGRVHGFVSFCPFREVMTLDAQGVGDSMRLVRKAVETRGFIGVKLYPPMGFAAWGNTGKTVWQGKPSLPPAAADPDFGKRLDAAMASLFQYCLANDLPIMAHTNHSNGPYEEFKDLAGSEYWRLALERFPGLSVSFGHFGDTDLEDHQGEKTRAFLALMSRDTGNGVKAYADSGYFAGALINQAKMRDVLRTMFAANGTLLKERLMYGTDWIMVLPQKNVDRYLADFIEIVQRVEKAEPGIGARGVSLSDAFFGLNAVEFLGLKPGRGNRQRLEAFYARNKVAEPEWMKKIGQS